MSARAPLVILLAEGDPTRAEAVRRVLGSSALEVELQVAGSIQEFNALAATRPPDIALVDPSLAGARDLLTSPAEAGPFPVLVLAHPGDEPLAEEALGSGALDYVVLAPEAFKELPRGVERALREWSLLQEVRRNETRINLLNDALLALARSEARYQGLVESLDADAARSLTSLASSLDRQRLAAERWQATFDAISDVVIVLSANLEIVEINRAGCQTYGVSRDEVIGRRCHEIVHGASEPIQGCPCLLAGETLQPTSLRYEERGRILELAAWPIGLHPGQKAGCVHIIRDMTGTETTLREKTLLEEQLKLAQRLEAIGRLAGGVAHDFNNLVSVIVANSCFVLEGLKETDPAHHDMVEILDAGRRAATLTRQLLVFSRKQFLRRELLSLNEVLLGIEGMLRRLMHDDIDVKVVRADPIGLVEADRGQIDQILMNLAINARDAMPHGGKLTIETAEVELDEAYEAGHVSVKPGRYICLSVTDTGCGMDPSTAGQVFEPFFTTKEAGIGTGLGLSMVYGIVKQSNGIIRVYSEPGLGTTLKIYLPRVEGSRADAHSPSDEELIAGQETVLIVEDEAPVRRVTERILKMAGYRVLTASDGREALRVCEQRGSEIDLLLTDVVMPEMDGRELTENLTSSCPHLKVLFMSGYPENAIVHNGVLEADIRLISKPFSAHELTRKVREVLDEDTSPLGPLKSP